MSHDLDKMADLLIDSHTIHPADALNQECISLDELEPVEQDQMNLAGIDPLTPVDGFLQMQGRTAFVTEI